MRKMAVTVILVATLGGCARSADPNQHSGAEGAWAATLSDDLISMVLGPRVELGLSIGEPRVVVDPSGDLHVLAVYKLYRSQDGGVSFEEVAPNLPGGGDGDLVTRDGQVHRVGLGRLQRIPFSHSEDGGITWSEPVDLASSSSVDRPWIIDSSSGEELYVTWRDFDQKAVVARTSFNGGESWGPHHRVSDDALAGPLATSPQTGLIYQAQVTVASSPQLFANEIRVARSADQGETWTLSKVTSLRPAVQVGLDGFAAGLFPVIAVDTGGTLYVVWSAAIGGTNTVLAAAERFGVYLALSRDDGESWTPPRLVSPPERSALMPWIAAGAEGRIAIAWYENTRGTPHGIVPDRWDVVLTEMLDADGPTPRSTRVTLTEQPAHEGTICTAGNACTTEDRALLDYLSVAIKADGHPIVSWAETDGPHQKTSEGVDSIRIVARGVQEGTRLR